MPSLPDLPVVSTAGRAPAERRLPSWLKRPVPQGDCQHFTAGVLRDLQLETVCENARCPNRMHCYSRKTATFMVLGNTCTRSCGFCAVARGRPAPPRKDEPMRVARAAQRLGLKHVVVTSVSRDDLPDGGAEHFCRCIEQIRRQTDATVEVLTPDFAYRQDAVDRVVDAAPDVFNHNTETVPRLYRMVRGPKSDYRRTLALLRRVRQRSAAIRIKSGLMLGLGETHDELLDTLADLLDAGCQYLTLGQYLRPAVDRYLPVARYLRPEQFTELGQIAKRMGFAKVASGPFVRSSYHAREMLEPNEPCQNNLPNSTALMSS